MVSRSKKGEKNNNSISNDNVPEPESRSLSNEDDSCEQEAALLSPLKAKESRTLSKVILAGFNVVKCFDDN